MYRYKRILVNLAVNEHDPPLIAYAAMVARMAHSETVYFAHVATSLEIPADIRTKYPELVRPADEHVRSQMARLVEEHFKDCDDVEVAHAIAEGPRLAALLRLITNKSIDLVLTGRHWTMSLLAPLHDRARCAAQSLSEENNMTLLNRVVCRHRDSRRPEASRLNGAAR